MTDVLLVTFALLPDGEPGGELLGSALAERGIDARWVCWDDDQVDWGAADLVAVRSTWDYHRRLPDFLRWAETVQARTELLNGAEVFAWNADKAYLSELADRVPTVPVSLLEDRALVPGLVEALSRWGRVVIKPRTGAGGVGVVVADRTDDPRLAGLTSGPWVVQPLVESVRTDGESSVQVLGGVPVAQVDKVPAAGSVGEVRVHEQYGGRSRCVVLEEERAAVARTAVEVAAERLQADLAYARVDLMRHEGRWAVSELELIEPGLYLDIDPGNAARFADMVAARLA